MKDDLISRKRAIDLLVTTYVEKGITNIHWTGVKAMLEYAPSSEPEIVRCHKCIHWNRDTVRQNNNDAGWWNEAVCERYSDEIWTSWKDADWYCADAERRTDE